MASFSVLEKTRDPRSRGKIATTRHRRHSTTPYDRPPASSQPTPERRNWLSDVIFPTTRMIASGAAKIFTSVFDSDESSSSLSSSDSTHASENDIKNDNYYETSNGFSCLNEDPGVTPRNLKSINEGSDANRIEQLLLTGKFSKEECDRLIHIINSRVSSATVERGRDLGSDVDDIFIKSVLKSRKWLEEKNVGYSPMSYRADTSDGSNIFSREQIDNEIGSPTDVAKSYMNSRPPWASPSAEHVILNSPVTSRSPFIREKILLSACEESKSLFKKRSRLVSDSWNIQEEISRVRSKATNDLLHSSLNTKTLDPLMISNVGGKNETLKAIPSFSIGSKRTAGEFASTNTGLGDEPRLLINSKVGGIIGKCDETENVNNYSTLSAEVGGIIEEIQSQLTDKKGDEITHVENKCAPDEQETFRFDNFSHGSGLVNDKMSLALSEPFSGKSDGTLSVPSSAKADVVLPEPYSDKSDVMLLVKQEGKKTGKYSRRSKVKGVNNAHDVAV